MPMHSSIKPFDGALATVDNGVMVTLTVNMGEEVATVHAKALDLGGADEGSRGLRDQTLYDAYFRDFDGNKVMV